MPDNFFSIPSGIPLSRFTAAITDTISGDNRLNGVWVIAELSDVRVSGGHCYMELIEKNEAGQTIAKLRANIWRNNFIQLRQKFYKSTGRDIGTGIKALVRGSATHHSIYGLAFNIFDIDPSYTMGDMERLRREIIMRLNKEGISTMNKNLSLPIPPQKIAVISAEGAAGYGDFIQQLSNNPEGFVFYPCLFPCVMQGDKVSESIRKALQIIESSAHLWDCVAIVRGGGATTDLNGFDDYELAKAVATCGLPVIVGIGHERDKNVLDEIAHTSLKTPTAVAGFFVDKAREAYEKVLFLADQLRVYSIEMIRGEERRFATVQTILPQLALRRISDAKSKLHNMTARLPLMLESKVGKERMKLDGMKNILQSISEGRLGKEKVRIDATLNFLVNITSNKIAQAGEKITATESLVKVLDPRNTLKRGYSITRLNGKSIKNIDSLSEGDILSTTTSDGIIKSKVVEKYNEL
ncbi:MAG: exodeoxyribonuclease VII large subunit [Muribaculaceae bacterium]|nr:exodeoxyribonuclease VII large subunit [Muribaculaceae bacterium]